MQHGGVEERALALNHPALWKEVLERYKGLRLNLAHVGIRGAEDPEAKYEWSHLIIRMMLEHENLYTDLACMTEKDAIVHLWELAEQADGQCSFDSKVTDRVMFGTDFWLNMLFKDLESYMKDFNAAFAEKPDTLYRLQRVNPRRFLKWDI